MVIENIDKVKNIIFDVGGILIDYRWEALLRDCGFDEEFAHEGGLAVLGHELWRKMDRGDITEQETVDGIHEIMPQYGCIADALFANLEEMRIPRENLYSEIDKLFGGKYNIYILSNYSRHLFDIHTSCIPFMDKFDGIVVSHDVRMLKPEIEIYEYILEKYGLVANECIFLDDNKENADAACQAGIKGIWAPNEGDVLEVVNMLRRN